MPLGTPLSPQSYGVLSGTKTGSKPKPPAAPASGGSTAPGAPGAGGPGYGAGGGVAKPPGGFGGSGGVQLGGGTAGTGGATMSAYGSSVPTLAGGTPLQQTPSSDPYVAFLQSLGVGYSGDQAAANLQFGTQQQLAGGYRDLGVGQLNDQYGFDMGRAREQEYRNVDLKRGENDRRQQSLDAQLAADNDNFQALGGFANRGLTDTIAYLNQQGGFNQQELSQALGYLAQQGGFAGQALEITRGANEQSRGFVGRQQQGSNAQAQARYDTERRGAFNDQASRGSSLSAGAMARSKDLDAQLGMARDDSQLTRDSAMAGLATSDRQSELGYNESIAGLNNQGSTARLGYDRDAASLANQGAGAQLGYDETMQGIDYQQGNTQRQYDTDVGAVKDNNAYLDSMAREYGIGRDEMQSSLKNGIEKLGLDYNQTLSTIAQAQNSSDANFRAAGMALTQQALDYATNAAVNVPASTATARTPQQRDQSMRQGASELAPGAPTSTAYRRYLNRQGAAGTNPAQDDLPAGIPTWTRENQGFG